MTTNITFSNWTVNFNGRARRMNHFAANQPTRRQGIAALGVLLLVLSATSFAEVERVTLRIGSDTLVSLAVTDLLDEQTRQKVPCLANTELITALRKLDPACLVTWESVNQILRFEIQQQRFSLFKAYSHLVANESLITVKHSLKTFEGEVYVPVSSLRTMLKFLQNIQISIPETVLRREAAAPLPPTAALPPAPATTTPTAGVEHLLNLVPTDEIPASPPGPATLLPRDADRPGGPAIRRILFDISGVYQLGIEQAEEKKAIAVLFAALAGECGASLTRRLGVSCETLDPGKRLTSRERLNLIAGRKADLVIMLKPGISRFEAAEGIRIYYPSDLFDHVPAATGGDGPIGRDRQYLPAAERTRELARAIHQKFGSSPVIQALAPQPASLFIARRLKAPAVLLELGHYSNAREAQLLRDEQYYFARTLAEALTEYLRP
ncbi:N-acetylmuramoyl-L-alanine amidase [Candidatus Sumerlaeota bacterium]